MSTCKALKVQMHDTGEVKIPPDTDQVGKAPQTQNSGFKQVTDLLGGDLSIKKINRKLGGTFAPHGS